MSFLPTIVHRSFYVSQTGDDANDGSLTNPFATINGALNAANQYPDSDNIVIEVGPGTYSDDITVTRYNTYIKSSTSRYEQRAVTVTGKTLVNYTGPQDKYNRVIGFQGIFFNHNSLTNPTLHISGSRNLTYLKDCYLASNGANTLKIENVTTASAKVVIANCAFLGQKGGADLVNIAGGDIKIDTVEAYFSSGSTGVGNGIVQSGNSLVAADRVLVDLSSTITGSAIVNGSTNYTGRPTLYLSNSSLGSTQATTNGAVYSTNVSYLWNVTLTDNSKIKGNNTAPNPFSVVLYSDLTSINALNFETITKSYLKDYMGDVVVNSLTSSAGFSGRIYGTASYALDAGINTSSFAKKNELNQFTNENWFFDDLQLNNSTIIMQTVNQALPTGDLLIYKNTNIPAGGGDVYVNGGDVYVQAGGSVSVDPGGHFTGSGAGITGLTGSNWSGGANKFRSDVRSLLSGGSGINYNTSSGVIESSFNPADYVTKVDADSTYAFVHQTNTFDAVQEITVNSALPALRVEQTSEGGAIAAFYSTASYPIPTIIDEYGNVAIKTTTVKQIPQNRSGANPPPIKFYTLNVNGGVYQEDPNSVGVQQNGPIGGLMPMIARNNNTTTQISNPNTPYYIYNSTGRLGLFARNNAVVNVIPSRWNAEETHGNDPARVFYYEVRQMNDYGSSPDFLFRIENNGEVIFKNLSGSTYSTTLTLKNTKDAEFAGAVTSSVGFSGDGLNVTNITASNITNFTDDVRHQFISGVGIDIDYNTGVISATGLESGLFSKGNITGSGLSANEFDLINDINVNSVTANNFYGTASLAQNSNNLSGITGSDYARKSITNTFTTNQNVQGTLSASILQGSGTGIVNLSGSNWGPSNSFVDDVRNQFSGTFPIIYDETTGEISFGGQASFVYATGPNLIGSGTVGEPLELNSNISVDSVTASAGFSGDLFGNAATATNADSLGFNPASSYARNNIVNNFNGAGTNNFNTLVDFYKSTRARTSNAADGTSTLYGGTITVSYPGTGSTEIKGGMVTASLGFSGDGSNLTNLSASQFPSWNSDVASSLVAGVGIYFTDNAGKTQINSSGGGGGGSTLTSGSITGSGLVGNEIRLKDDIIVTTITSSGSYINYIDFNTSSVAPVANIAGRIHYDTVAGDLQYHLGSSDTVNLGQQLVQKVQNLTGDTLTKGTVVHITGQGQGTTPRVESASVFSDAMSANTLGVLMNNILHGDSGYVLLNGVLQDVHVPGTSGDALYLSGSAGGFSIDKVDAPQHLVSIGQIIKPSNGNSGIIYVKIQNGYELSELHDVYAPNGSKLNGDLLTWNSSSIRWENGKTLSGSYTIAGDLSSSLGFYTPPGVTSQIQAATALSASTILDTSVARRNTKNTFTGIENIFSGTTIFAGPVNFNNPQSFSDITASNAYITNNLFINGTASIAHLNTIEQSALQIGDKYIILASSSIDHADLDQGGILWGSGSTGTVGPSGEHAYIRYDIQHDHLHVFPGLHITGALTSSESCLIEGSLTVINNISASSYSGDGSGLINITAQSSNTTNTQITTTNTVGTLAVGSTVAFSGSYLCSADYNDNRRSNVAGIITNIDGNTYTITTTGLISGSNGGDFIGGDIVYVGSDGALSSYDNIPAGGFITQIGIASLDAGTTGNILLQPRIYGTKS